MAVRPVRSASKRMRTAGGRPRAPTRRAWSVEAKLVRVYSQALMRRFRALVVLLVVSFNAMWCLDGCIDPFAFNGPSSASAASTSSDIPDTPEARTCVMCVVPFEQERAIVLVPAWAFGVTVPVFRAVSPPLAPRTRIEHPPRAV